MARLLFRIGLISARHRWWTIAAWSAALVVTAVITLTSMRFSDGAFEIPGTESSSAMATLEEEFGTTTADGEGSLQVVGAAHRAGLLDG